MLVADVPQGGRAEAGCSHAWRRAAGHRQRRSARERDAGDHAGGVQGADADLRRRRPRPPLERQAQQAEGTQNLWRYGLLLMLAALVGESVVGRTR